jgi:hypothetical protein
MNNVDHPNHYNREGAMETIDEMLLLFGVEEVKSFCKLNAWKYRSRALYKNKEEDMSKSDWYLNKYKELCETYDSYVSSVNCETYNPYAPSVIIY